MVEKESFFCARVAGLTPKDFAYPVRYYSDVAKITKYSFVAVLGCCNNRKRLSYEYSFLNPVRALMAARHRPIWEDLESGFKK